LEYLFCTLTPEVQCFTVHPSPMIWQTKIRKFWRTGNDSKQPYCHRCTWYRGENHRPAASHWQTLSHNVVHLILSGIRTHNVNGDKHWLYSSCKSNYHTITTVPYHRNRTWFLHDMIEILTIWRQTTITFSHVSLYLFVYWIFKACYVKP
jgi:hypothetical protein